MRIGVPKEILPGERRVALVPDVVARLVRAGAEVYVQAGAGEGAYFPDTAYREAGAHILPHAVALFGEADVVLKVRGPGFNEVAGRDEVDLLREGSVLIGLLDPLRRPELVRRLAERRITALSMDTIPRIARAQRMDALSSQAAVAGYRAALLGAARLGRFFPMLTTAAGTIPPARVLVLGAGVAGLQAIATARRLGAVVEAFDVRPAVKEQVESLGARFVGLPLEEPGEGTGGYAKELSEEARRREQALLREHVREADVVITTAQVPGRPAPRLVTAEMVREMRPGSVIVDVAAETGGNCELTEVGRETVHNGVTVVGAVNLPSALPVHASQMYARNLAAFLELLRGEDGGLRLDFDDEIVRESCITHEGRVIHGPSRAALGVQPGPA